MRTRLHSDLLDAAISRLERAQRRASRHRVSVSRPTPVHTLLVTADRYRSDVPRKANMQALDLLQAYAPDCVVLASALGLPGAETLPTDPARVDALLARLEGVRDATIPAAARMAHDVYQRLVHRLQHHPVQDVRVDFGARFGIRPDDEVDATAAAVGEALARGSRERTGAPRFGIRLAPLTAATAPRVLRTLDLVVSTLAASADGRSSAEAFGEGFVVSMSGVRQEDAISAMVPILAALEVRNDLRKGSLHIEIGVDGAEGVVDRAGAVLAPTLLAATMGRCSSFFVDASGITESLGAVDDAQAVRARDLVRLSLHGTGLPVVYGTSPPVPQVEPGRVLGSTEQAERFAALHAAWKRHADQTRLALRDGVTWGWDLEAGMVPARLAAIYAWYRVNLETLRAWMAHSMTTAGTQIEDPDALAEGQRRLDLLATGLDCGALDQDDLRGLGLDREDLAVGSFRAALSRRT